MHRLLARAALSAALLCVHGTATAAGPPEKGEKDENERKSKKKKKKVRERTKGNVGIGILVPNPAALSLKIFLAPKHALSFGLGYAWLMSPDEAGRKGTYRLHIDYAWHPGALASNQVMDLIPYVGVGIGSGFFIARLPDPDGGAGHLRARPISFLRLPVLGLSFHWQRVPMDTAIEASWTPAMIWLPSPHGDLPYADFGVAVRYYF